MEHQGTCPRCGSPLKVIWSRVGGRGERLVARCTCQHGWCSFSVTLEGHEYLFADSLRPAVQPVAQGATA